MASSFDGKSMAPGGGGRFAKMTAGLEKKGMPKSEAGAIAASAGRAKFGAKKFNRMAQAGRAKSMGRG